MFGDVAFAEAPFASLGGKTVLADLSASAEASASVVSESNFGGLISEQAAVNEATVSANNALIAFMAELVAASDAQSVISSVLATASESATATDAPTASSSVLAAVSELARATDAPTANTALLAFVAEAVAALDAPNASRVFAVAISEQAAGADAPSAQGVFSGTVAELVAALDASAVARTANVPVTGVQLIVSIGGELIWVPIDDSQNPNWINLPS